MKWLTLLMLLPLAGAAIISALPKAKEKAAKQAAFATSLIVMAATFAMAAGFERDNVDLQFVEKYSWIPSFGISYALGVDAIALVLILMSTILVPVVVLVFPLIEYTYLNYMIYNINFVMYYYRVSDVVKGKVFDA